MMGLVRRRAPLRLLCVIFAVVAGGCVVGGLAGARPAGTGYRAKNVLIFVADGLRHGSVNPKDAPILYRIRHEGVNFENSHSLFPTFTTANASVIATGHYLGDTGDFSNTIYAGFPVPGAGYSVFPFLESDPVLADMDQRYSGNYLNEETLLAAARRAGYSTAAVGKLGPTLIQDVTQGNRRDGRVPPPRTIVVDDSTGHEGGVPLSSPARRALRRAGLPLSAPGRGANGDPGDYDTPGTKVPNTAQQRYFVAATTRAILPLFKRRGRPFVIVYWSRDPDGTQHNQGDSLNRISPGINGPTSRAAVRDADHNLQRILDALRKQGLARSTDVMVTSDHGFSTISRSVVGRGGGRVKDYASSLLYPDVRKGFLPPGFLAIDLAHRFRMPLYDPDQASSALGGKIITYGRVRPALGDHPEFGNGLIGGTGRAVGGRVDARFMVAANGGSDLIYVQYRDRLLLRRMVDFLSRQDYVSGLFVNERVFGRVPGALPLGAIGLQGAALTPTPSIVVNFRSFLAGGRPDYLGQVEIADTTLQQGQGMHGSFGRADTYNNMEAIGPDFRRGYVDRLPVSNADVVPTAARILGLDLPSGDGSLTGRVMQEAFRERVTHAPYRVVRRVLRSSPAVNGERTVLRYQRLGRVRYFDVAGFPGRTVGLR
ncbi:alkaline phosphatase family protein [Rubrobacter calidifluminis]|uniref:alkaline phosphatase family protein n=1 Tax=Rubrobacter calidifluminis TaxID=1392640 RepID=UPI002362DA17|nr:alkaline phosphatase family protein [Rubrobacter calidifluminis]